MIHESDIPQVFSHFTHRYTKRKKMVCDLQGVLNKSASPPVFELTDPVIHYASTRGRKNVYGRTDRKKGMNGQERDERILLHSSVQRSVPSAPVAHQQTSVSCCTSMPRECARGDHADTVQPAGLLEVR